MYTTAFLNAVNHLMIYEVGPWWNVNAIGAQAGTNARACGYVNNPADPGGETKYGISRNENPTINVTYLNWDGAQAIYYSHYWLNGKCDRIDGHVAALHFDACVNNGVGTAAKFLQRAVNVTDDGVIGPGTIAAISLLDPMLVCNSMCDQRDTYYNEIVTNNPSQAQYLAGWLRRVAEMRAYVTNPNNSF